MTALILVVFSFMVKPCPFRRGFFLSFAFFACCAYFAKKFKMILLSNLHRFVERGKFSITFVAENGEVVHCAEAICTSWHSRGRTMNVKLITSTQVRTIRRCTVIAFNDEEVAL